MTKNVVTVNATESIFHVAQTMREQTTATLVVLEDEKPVGILTERDFVRKALANNLNPVQTKVLEMMSKPLLSTNPDASIGKQRESWLTTKSGDSPSLKKTDSLG